VAIGDRGLGGVFGQVTFERGIARASEQRRGGMDHREGYCASHAVFGNTSKRE